MVSKLRSILLLIIISVLMMITSSIQAIDVLSNLTGTYSTGTIISHSDYKGVAFTVQGGTYVLDSFEAIIQDRNNAPDTLTATLHVYNGGQIPGAVIATIASASGPTGSAQSLVTFTASSPIILTQNTSYWIILSANPISGLRDAWQQSAVNPSGQFDFIRYTFTSSGGSVWSSSTVENAFRLNVSVPSAVVPDAEDGILLPAFYDGRINDYDTAAPVAVYPHFVDSDAGLIIYNPDGVQLLVVSAEQIANAPDNPDANVLIASANGVSLYRIRGEGQGYWQVNAPQYNGKTYVMIFPELFHSGGYESFELEG